MIRAGFRTFTLKRLWNNLASIRDYNVKECLQQGLGLRVEVEGSEEFMEIPHYELKDRAFQATKSVIRSKYGKNYTLVDFKWIPNNPSYFSDKQAPTISSKPKDIDDIELPVVMYKDGEDEKGKYIICSWCGTKSHNVNDVRFKFCYRCQRYLNVAIKK